MKCVFVVFIGSQIDTIWKTKPLAEEQVKWLHDIIDKGFSEFPHMAKMVGRKPIIEISEYNVLSKR